MDKTAIKNFSIWARNKLIADITYKAGLLGVTEEGIKDALPQSTQDAEFYDIGTKEPYAIHGEEIKQRKELVAAIKKKATQLDYKDAYRNVVEEVAYTWFNRLIAIRFMEVNDYMPAHIRVLSSDSKNKLEPDLVTTPFDAELEFTQAETEKIMLMKNDNQVDALFRFLFIKQCNALNAYLPKLFEKTSDYTELLLNVSVTDQDGIVYHLTHDIAEADFNITDLGEDGKPTGQVEIIGWMYQYYNTEPKDEAFALLKSNVKITKERIPAATQLFTPDWIVRYMVENSVGRLWLEGHADKNLKDGWKYYLDEAEQEADVAEQLKAIREEYKNIKPEEIKVIDPCMGSGHILVYAFDVLMQIYESYGYSQRDAAKSIVENNIYGLDIDDRAFQLAYFAIMMKARSYNRRFLTLEIEPNLCAIQESNGLQYDKDMGDFLLNEEHRETLKYLLNTFVDAKEYGSILNVEKRDYDGFLEAWRLTAEASLGNVVMMLWYNECNQIVPVLVKQAKMLAQQYEVVITNPPYMGRKQGMNARLLQVVERDYPECTMDMYAVFMKKAKNMCMNNGFVSMITQHSWMFLGSYEKLRGYMQYSCLISMLHLGARAFEDISGEVVQTCSYIYVKNDIKKYKSVFVRLTDYNSQTEKEMAYLNEQAPRYLFPVSKFSLLPGAPMSYWISQKMSDAYSRNQTFMEVGHPSTGMMTANNDKYLRLWYEVNYEEFINKDAYGDKWIKYLKGGAYRKWYGNLDYLLHYNNNANFILQQKNATVMPIETLKKIKCTWTDITSGKNSFRVAPMDTFHDKSGHCFYPSEKDQYWLLGYSNSIIFQKYLDIFNQTIHCQAGDVGKVVIPEMSEAEKEYISLLSKEAVQIVKEDWDSKETSWDFVANALCSGKMISESIENLIEMDALRRKRLTEIEEQINHFFAEKFDIQDEEFITVPQSTLSLYPFNISECIKELISYAVGCMFGRYSLDEGGIVFAGGEWDDSRYNTYNPVEDNIILLTDEEYFADDIVGRFCEWLKAVYGIDTLEQNLEYISKALDGKGSSSRKIIRNYFIKDFLQYENKLYQKKPIFWLFDSGKENGFKALVYMHRYNANTIGNLRVDYLHRIERIYESEINRMQDTIDNSSNAREVTAATKRKEKLQKQLKECQEYDEKIGHLALSRIDIDLDDGVKVNYEKVQTANDGKKYQVLAKL